MSAFALRRALPTMAACALVVACGARSDLGLDAPIADAGDVGIVDAGSRDAAAVDAGVDASLPPDAGIVDASSDAPLGDASVDADGDGCTTGCGLNIPAPRPIAPLSTARATSQTPTLRWALAGAATGARVTICRDRVCAQPVTTFDATGSSGVPLAPLSAGIHFWRLRGMAGTQVGTTTSATWELFVGAASAPVDTSWGSTLDANGDGYVDVVTSYSGAQGFTPAVHYYAGGSGGPASSPVLLTMPPTRDINVGSWITSAGDVDGDGFPEILTAGQHLLALYAGGPNGPSATPTVIDLPSGYTARMIAGAGDVDRDGYADVVVGTYDSHVSEMLLYRGGPSGLSTQPIVVADPSPSTDHYASFGSRLSAGDVDGDGYSDVFVGSGTTLAGSDAAGVYVFRGSSGGLVTSTPSFRVTSGGAWFNMTALDVNGDGFDDVALSNMWAAPDGVVNVFTGSASGLAMTPVIIDPPSGFGTPTNSDYFGPELVAAGDVDGDGIDDLVVSYDTYTTGENPCPNQFLFLGGRSGIATTPSLLARARIGWTYGIADVNGDGYADFVSTCPGLDFMLYLGGPTQTTASTHAPLLGSTAAY